MNQPYNPHAIITLNVETTNQQTKKKELKTLFEFDSWEQDSLFESLRVELTTNESSEVEWKFFDPQYKILNNLSKQHDKFLDNLSNQSGVPLFIARVYLGYGKSLGEPLFKGMLARVEREEANTVLRFYDMGFKMKLLKRAGYHNKKDDLVILKTLAERNGLMFSPPKKPLKLEPHKAMTQDEQTDWEHALERAQDAGLILFVRHDTLFARYPAQTNKQHPKAVFSPKELLRGYKFDYIAPEGVFGRSRVVEFRGRGKGGRRLTGVSDKNKRGHTRVVLKRDTSGRHSKSKLSRRAQAQKDLTKQHLFEGSVSYLFPTSSLIPDVLDTVYFRGFGSLFSGYYLCDGVAYNFSAGKLEVELDVYRNTDDF